MKRKRKKKSPTKKIDWRQILVDLLVGTGAGVLAELIGKFFK